MPRFGDTTPVRPAQVEVEREVGRRVGRARDNDHVQLRRLAITAQKLREDERSRQKDEKTGLSTIDLGHIGGKGQKEADHAGVVAEGQDEAIDGHYPGKDVGQNHGPLLVRLDDQLPLQRVGQSPIIVEQEQRDDSNPIRRVGQRQPGLIRLTPPDVEHEDAGRRHVAAPQW